MSDEEDFLKRWSRRKRAAAEVAKSEPPEAQATDVASAAAPENEIASDQSADTPHAEFDPATLPPIESITAVSDITAFLRAGVPAELTRAALRRVWMADPAIRDFIGLAENAWDFTDPNAMPGFGPLESTEEVRRMIARIVDGIGQAAQPDTGDAPGAGAKVSRNISDNSAINADAADVETAPVVSIADQSGESPAETLRDQVLLHGNKEDAAMQYDDAEAAEKPKQSSRRGHGGALPR